MLKNKKLVIIGGTSGIGLSAARAFVQAGARVVVVGNDNTAHDDAQQELGEAGVVIQADAREEATAVEAIEVCRSRFGGFDGLYHVAGGSGRKWGDGPLGELSLEAWQRTLDLNLTAVMLSNRAAIRALLAMKKPGSILNLGSVLGTAPSVSHFTTISYATAKSALIGLTKSSAAYYAAHNIRVNVLAPALVATPMSARAQQNPDVVKFIKTKQPLDGGRIGQPTDLDGLACYFMSDLSRFTTGQVIAVDGGWSLSDGQL